MTDDRGKREGQSGGLAKKPASDPRRDRLKQALRENLKRRKSQARGRGEADAPTASDDVPPHDASGKKPGE